MHALHRFMHHKLDTNRVSTQHTNRVHARHRAVYNTLDQLLAETRSSHYFAEELGRPLGSVEGPALAPMDGLAEGNGQGSLLGLSLSWEVGLSLGPEDRELMEIESLRVVEESETDTIVSGPPFLLNLMAASNVLSRAPEVEEAKVILTLLH
jgi:hypothetical protein